MTSLQLYSKWRPSARRSAFAIQMFSHAYLYYLMGEPDYNGRRHYRTCVEEAAKIATDSILKSRRKYQPHLLALFAERKSSSDDFCKYSEGVSERIEKVAHCFSILREGGR